MPLTPQGVGLSLDLDRVSQRPEPSAHELERQVCCIVIVIDIIRYAILVTGIPVDGFGQIQTYFLFLITIFVFTSDRDGVLGTLLLSAMGYIGKKNIGY